MALESVLAAHVSQSSFLALMATLRNNVSENSLFDHLYLPYLAHMHPCATSICKNSWFRWWRKCILTLNSKREHRTLHSAYAAQHSIPVTCIFLTLVLYNSAMAKFPAPISQMRLMVKDLVSPAHSVIYVIVLTAHHVSQPNFITLKSSLILDLVLELIRHR